MCVSVCVYFFRLSVTGTGNDVFDEFVGYLGKFALSTRVF